MKYNLSVVVLVYNTAEYLHDCIDSLLSQSLKNIEIILVDDDSTDDSLLICREYEEKHENVTVIHQHNQGGAVAGNNGVKHATGEYVAIIDSDDIVPSNAYKTLFERAQENKADISIGKPMRLVSGKVVEIALDREKHVWQKDRVINSYVDFEAITSDGYYWNKIFKRDFVAKHKIRMPDGFLYADRTMVHSAYMHAKKIVITDQVVYLWRKRDATTANKSIIQSSGDLNNLKERLKSFEHENDIFMHNEDFCLNIAQDSISRLLFNIKNNLSNIQTKNFYLNEVGRFFRMFDLNSFSYLTPREKLLCFFISNKMEFELGYYLSQMWRPFPYNCENGKLYIKLPNTLTENVPDFILENRKLDSSNIRDSQVFSSGDEVLIQCIIREYSSKMDIKISLISDDELLELNTERFGDYYLARVDKSLLKENSNYYITVSDGLRDSIYLRRVNFEPKIKNNLLSGIFIRFTASAKYVRVKRVKFSLELLKKGLIRELKKF
ncbi:glycosyltransferase [Vibrio cyclitrophicus]|uniref:Glycosyltransferase n=1 Tax=Vibrio cyclitrophicus ZF270 TaxID=1136176 RepID=A0AAN0N9X6_9VIBR|nr:glycosyltransferase [Vibrio cyclitrophicus]OEE04246.1 hypothetical protein OC7_10390 [Vibrio cyclitrophicus ZF270]